VAKVQKCRIDATSGIRTNDLSPARVRAKNSPGRRGSGGSDESGALSIWRQIQRWAWLVRVTSRGSGSAARPRELQLQSSARCMEGAVRGRQDGPSAPAAPVSSPQVRPRPLPPPPPASAARGRPPARPAPPGRGPSIGGGGGAAPAPGPPPPTALGPAGSEGAVPPPAASSADAFAGFSSRFCALIIYLRRGCREAWAGFVLGSISGL
jgi:hypothetical protein